MICDNENFTPILNSSFNEIVKNRCTITLSYSHFFPIQFLATTHQEWGMIRDFTSTVADNIEKVIIGKRETIELLLVAILCEGHVLIEDFPGLGKTMLARSLATSIGGNFKRVQCTPDLLPNDVTGVSIYNQQNGEFEFREGPVFVNVLLADEINRATPRTQSALLEAMQEYQVTVDGVTHPLPRPFLVVATQNPIEFEGTFPLPEAQLDRFIMRLAIGYPRLEEELILFKKMGREHPINSLTPVVENQEILNLQKQVWDIFCEPSLQEYILQIVTATRQHTDLALGVSPRGSLALYKTSQAYAAIQGRDHVIPDDIQTLLPWVFAHRIILKPEAELRGRTAVGILTDILHETPLDLA
jgi:MoxR-like ATPase